MKIKDDESLIMISKWRPVLGNSDDIEIYSILKKKKKKRDKSNNDEARLKELLLKRIKEGAVRGNYK